MSVRLSGGFPLSVSRQCQCVSAHLLCFPLGAPVNTKFSSIKVRHRQKKPLRRPGDGFPRPDFAGSLVYLAKAEPSRLVSAAPLSSDWNQIGKKKDIISRHSPGLKQGHCSRFCCSRWECCRRQGEQRVFGRDDTERDVIFLARGGVVYCHFTEPPVIVRYKH